MPIAHSNDIELYYETSGDPGDRPLILIMGLGLQLIRWPEGFCERLCARGHHVIRFDNRDVGRSTGFREAGVPDFHAVLRALANGERPTVPYTLSDMAADTAGLMDTLGLEAAHVLGVSLGGMIAQTFALEHPDRVLTLTSMMSTTGRPELFGQDQETEALIGRPVPEERDAYVTQRVEVDRLLNGPFMPFDEDGSRRAAGLSFERGIVPFAPLRHVAAVLASGSRHEALASLELPSLVVHGDADRVIPVEGGRDTARCIPNARYLELPGLAHSLPAPVWDPIAEAVALLTQGSGEKGGVAS